MGYEANLAQHQPPGCTEQLTDPQGSQCLAAPLFVCVFGENFPKSIFLTCFS